MKAIIWIIVLALVVWGIWWFVRDDAGVNTGTGAGAAGALDLNLNSDADASVDGDVDLTEFEDKG